MSDVKQTIESLILGIKKGEMDLQEAWERVKKLKKLYVEQYSQQSWNTFIGNKFQQAIFSNLEGYFNRLKIRNSRFKGISVFTESQIKGNDIISRKLAVRYGEEHFLLPDTDMAIIDYDFTEPWKSKILAIVSCKTSLRERIAQACYWKLKLLASETTKNTNVFLATTDNDQDFSIISKKDRYAGKHRNRVIAEYELDGVYVLRRDFKKKWENDKVKQYGKIFSDIVQTFKKS